MSDYQALTAYLGVCFVVFVGGVVWHKFRKEIKKRIPLTGYGAQERDERVIQHH
jgi:hypothetical protein